MTKNFNMWYFNDRWVNDTDDHWNVECDKIPPKNIYAVANMNLKI